MGQVSKYLRRKTDGYAHWCPACKEMHSLPDTWIFNGNVDKPSFQPSFRHSGVQTVNDENGKWTGDWKRDANGKALPFVCHYILTDGILHFCGDCTHSMSGQSIQLPELPPYYRD